MVTDEQSTAEVPAVPRVKICGITTESDRTVAIRAGADALGFIVDVPVDTPRELPVERAAELVAGAGPFVTTVLVTMPERVADAVTLHEQVGTDVIQVHGGLTPSQVQGLSDRVGADVIVGVDIHDPDVEAYAAPADALLVDSTDDQGAGGTGETHDWGRTRELRSALDTPLVLAGGLTPGNVTEAVETVAPFAVDTATGVERTGGRKDHEAVAAFVRRARGTEVTAR